VAETSSAAVILTSTHLGFPLSTTQVATGSVFGAGAGRRMVTVSWGVGRKIALAWVLTLPAAAAVGALAARVAASGTAGTTAVAGVAMAVALGIFGLSRRRPVTAENVNELPARAPVCPPTGQAA
jgi:PiT family inorganic phosphate transporter